MTPELRPATGTVPSRSATAAAWVGIVGVSAYVGAWWLAGRLAPGYDAREDAISELFAHGAPSPGRELLLVGLGLSAVAMLALAPALHRHLPGRGAVGPALVAIAGLGTGAVALAPCSPGCPGTGVTPTDTAHTLTAAVAYLALVAAPLAFAVRSRRAAPRLARWSALLGGLALGGFGVRYLGVVEVAPGWQQRGFNTVADAWFVLAAVWLLRRRRAVATACSRARGRARPRRRRVLSSRRPSQRCSPSRAAG